MEEIGIKEKKRIRINIEEKKRKEGQKKGRWICIKKGKEYSNTTLE